MRSRGNGGEDFGMPEGGGIAVSLQLLFLKIH